MTIFPVDPGARGSLDALRGFLEVCRDLAREKGRAQLVSISLEVEPLDPLAVLESIFEPGERHFYVERPDECIAIAGAEAVLEFGSNGPGRFSDCRRFVEETLNDAIAVGNLEPPFSGPHFFAAFGFADRTVPGDPFGAAGVFVPRWQVARSRDGTVAVANAVVGADTVVEELAAKIWRAHGKFRGFDYAEAEFRSVPAGGRAVSIAEDPAGYVEAVRVALAQIAAGAYEKIVLARTRELSAGEGLHPLRVLNGLRQRYGDCFSFSVANGRGQSFIGASPERLLRVDGGELLTEALAGSAPRGASASEDAVLASALLRDDKENREHRLVVDAIVSTLRALGLQPGHPARPGLRKFANVQHLHTPIRAAVPENVALLDILGALHPTPAVGGTPRDAAVARIAELESLSRGLYAGAMGWMDSRHGGEFFVGLRSALIDGTHARLYAGAGIVAGSSPQKELAETELKFRAMQEALLA